MKKKICIVSGCDQNYFDLIKNLILSLKKSKSLDLADLCVFNINFNKRQLSFLKKYCSKIKKPNWDIKIKYPAKEWKKLLMCRPFIINYFKGYEQYIWLDADTFVQNNKFIDKFYTASKKGKISICTETDINYLNNQSNSNFKKIFFNIFKIKGWTYKNNKKYLNKKFAEFQIDKPLFNAGVFSIPKESKLWADWKNLYKKILLNAKNEYALNMDQASLNYCLYKNLSRVNIFDAKYNWLVKNKTPLICTKTNKYYSNQIPCEEISILHLTHIDYKKEIQFLSLNNKKILKKII